MVQGWSQDDLTYGEITDIRLKGSDINNDAVLDYVVWRPTSNQFFFVPSSMSKAQANAYGAITGSTGLPTYAWEPNYTTPGAQPAFAADLAESLAKYGTTHVAFNPFTSVENTSPITPTSRQTVTGSQLGLTKGNDFYWMDMGSVMGSIKANKQDKSFWGTPGQSYEEATEREKRVSEAARIGTASEQRQKALQIEAEGRGVTIAQAAEQRQHILQEELTLRQERFQLGLSPIYSVDSYGKGTWLTPQTVQEKLTRAAEERQQAWSLGPGAESQLKTAKESADYTLTEPFRKYQEDLAIFSSQKSFDLQTSKAAYDMQRTLAGESAKRSEDYQSAEAKYNRDWQISKDVGDFQKALSDYSLNRSSETQFGEASTKFQQSMADYSSKLAGEQYEIQNLQNRQFQEGLQNKAMGYGSLTSGSILATSPLSRYYQGGRQGMIKGFAMGKANLSFRFNMPHRDPVKLSGKSMASKFVMKPLVGKSVRIPNINHTQHGKNMATAFGFTHITPVAIVHPIKQAKINPPHRPKSMAKQMRVVVGTSVGRPKKRR
jgi:hypothetical protein